VRKRPLHAQHAVGKINVTPLIDVVMCLIIFYLIVGRLATDRSVVVPRSTTGLAESGPAPLTIEIVDSDDGSGGHEVVVSGALVDASGLEKAVSAAAAGSDGPRPVQIRAGQDLPYSALSPVLSACKRAGLTSVRLVTERAQ
jgi:biopolymer transport protein ExbD